VSDRRLQGRGDVVQAGSSSGAGRGTGDDRLAEVLEAVDARRPGRPPRRRLADELRAQNDELERLTYRADVAGAGGTLELNNVVTARALLTVTPERLRDWEWRHFHGRLDGPRTVVPGWAPARTST
jgi:hypothetical protein